MSQPLLWEISVRTSSEAEEAVMELLGSVFGQPALSYTNAETGAVTVSVYFPKQLDWPGARRVLLKAGLERIKACGLKVGSGRIRVRRIRLQDWAESWKRHFKPIKVGSALRIEPSWNRGRRRRGLALVILDPGLTFGTGQHPTTAFCLTQLVSRRHPSTRQSFLDLGTGSGILATAAAKLGYAPVHAVERDPEAVQIARRNARINRVKVHFLQRDLGELSRRAPRQFSVVCANLTSDLILAERDRILARLQPEGILVLAGILRTEFPQVQRAYEAAGLRLTGSRAEKEWRSGVFVWRCA